MSIFNPENFTMGTGLIDDVDVLFKEVRVDMFDYNGKALNGPVPALKITMEVEGSEEGEHIQYYSLGKATDWQPSDDNTCIVAVGKATGISSNSNAALLIASMVNAGFPTNKIEDDVRCFEGLRAHMTRVPAPKRSGLVKQPREDGRTFEETVLIVGTILSLPGEGKKAAAAPKGKPATAPAAGAGKAAAPKANAGADAVDIDAVCAENLIAILAEKGGEISKAQIPALILPKVKELKEKNKIVARVFTDDFLNKQDGWTFENGKVSLG